MLRGCWPSAIMTDRFTLKRNGMATLRLRKKGTLESSAAKGEAIADLMLEVAQFFFRIRAVGQRTGLITGWGGGAFGFMSAHSS